MKLADKQHHLLVVLSIWSAVLAGVGFVAAAAGRMADLRAGRVRQDAQWRLTVRGLLQECPNGMPPRLSALSDAALGTTETRYTRAGNDPYVHRPDTDRQLAQLFAAGGPPFGLVIVVGASKAGKSRTAAHAARAALSQVDPPVLLPRNGEALAALMRLDQPIRLLVPTLVWLDDLTATDLSHLTGEVLDIVARHGWLVATMTEDRWNAIRNSSGDVAATARAALGRATKVELGFELNETEAAEAHRLYPGERVTASIGETLVGGQWLMDRYRAGRTEQPAGYALVQAAVDARRIGLSRPISASELQRLFPLYLRRVRIDLDPTTALFNEGLTWAKQPVASQVALVTATSDGGFEVLDYVLAVEDGQDNNSARSIPEQTWAEVIDAVPATDAYDIGIAAYLKGNLRSAVAAMCKAVDSGDAAVAPMASLSLGLLLAEQGDVTGARAAYQLAIDSGHTPAAPAAAFSLGGLLEGQGDVTGARAAYQLAIDSGDAAAAPAAAFSLGLLLEGQGDVTGARAAYQLAIDSGDAAAAPAAAVSLGRLLAEQGDVTGARAAYQLAIDSGDATAAAMAALGLGLLLEEQGDVTGARASYQLAIDSGDAAAAPLAAVSLGLLLEEQGDVTGARASYQSAIDSGHATAAPMAADYLRKLKNPTGEQAVG
ncbi:hypothetical protein GCM10023322_01620 [Rugosimonospora acidiphila]|uniref:Tetratricopeptide repeat protein n=2 Tax=Rugosimonospora acidiphila TaxID=556531 RepID=A0ABP9RGE8_9ACTN